MPTPEELVDAARDAQTKSHSPYSNYSVGAAIATDKGVFTGTNIENANYTNTVHAEGAALTQAHMNDASEYLALAIVEETEDGTPPCGHCRQTLAELCPPDMPVHSATTDSYLSWTVGELLPEAMDPEDVISQSD